jgi:hypothetical protein
LADLFWYTDRTHVEMGLGHCRRARWLSKHAGPTGYGLVAKSESLPLATGTYIHLAAQPLLQILKDLQRLPTTEEVRAGVAIANGAYEIEIGARGFRGLLASQTTEEVIKEQQGLLTGLIWAFSLKFLPWLHREYRVLSVEEERNLVISCECGLTRTDPIDQHQARGCAGIVLQQRLDLIGQGRASNRLAYFELKTTGSDISRFSEEYEVKPQLSLGNIDVEARFGQSLSELYVVGLYKGYREKIYDAQDQIVGMRQMSPFATAYMKPGNPPLTTDDWKTTYRYVNEQGQKKQVSKEHQKTPIWKLGDSDWPAWIAHQDVAMTPAEFWVRTLPDSTLEAQLYLLGPMNLQADQLASLLIAIPEEEKRWQAVAWELYELQQNGLGWAHPEFMAALDRLAPQSWDCRRFGKSHQCQYLRLCFKDQGWEDPIGSGHYIPRLPHHSGELAQAVSRGLLPDQAAPQEEMEG